MHSLHPTIAPLHRLMAFSQAVHVRRMIEGIAVEPKQSFWIMTINLLADTAAIEWCKVFGSWDEQTHWTKVVPQDRLDAIRGSLLQATKFDQAGWKVYRDGIVDYRNQMVAHHDLSPTVAKYPQFDPALAAADFMFFELRALADPHMLGGIPMSLDKWALGVAVNMAPIVRKAFSASAVLGSNLPH